MVAIVAPIGVSDFSGKGFGLESFFGFDFGDIDLDKLALSEECRWDDQTAHDKNRSQKGSFPQHKTSFSVEGRNPSKQWAKRTPWVRRGQAADRRLTSP